jgi:LacI family repressor for deo operon, udp, cdd, tsx, nupC, and nupG
MSTSILDVAKAADVSVATVSRVLNDPGKVSEDTRERVHAAITALGYQPNLSARNLRTQRSKVLGVVLPTLLNPVFAECLSGIAAAASAAGYAIQPFFSDYLVAREEHAVNLLMAGNAEGVILVVSNPDTSPALRRLYADGRPYVLAYNLHPHHPCVTVDSEEAMIEMVACLADIGHRRIAMVTGHLEASDRAQQRCRGYQRAMLAAGLQPLPITEVSFVDADIDTISRLLQPDARPTALIGSNDLIAIRCLRAAQLCGLRVPEDISVVGFDGIGLGADLYPQLATVKQPNQDIGLHCVQLLMQAIGARTRLDAQSTLLLPYMFDTAESCGPPGPCNTPEGALKAPRAALTPTSSKPTAVRPARGG